jgi:hypothetical protein
MAQLLQTKQKEAADALIAALDFEGLEFWLSRRKRSIAHVPGRMLYIVNVRERDLARAQEIKAHYWRRDEP